MASFIELTVHVEDMIPVGGGHLSADCKKREDAWFIECPGDPKTKRINHCDIRCIVPWTLIDKDKETEINGSCITVCNCKGYENELFVAESPATISA